MILQDIQPDKPRVESTTIAVTAKPPESDDSQGTEGNEPATQDQISNMQDNHEKGSTDSLSVQNRGNTGLRRSQSETTTNRPRRYHEIINTDAPTIGGDGDYDSNSLNSPDTIRRHSTPLKGKQDDSPENSEKDENSEKNKPSGRHRRFRSDGTPSESKRSGKRSRYHTIEVLATPDRVKEDDKENIEVDHSNNQNSALHRNNNNVNIESTVSNNQDSNKPAVETAPLATQEEDLDVDIEGRPRTLSDLSSHSSEDLERMDNPRKSRLGLRLNKAMLDHSDSPSPSKRTIERRRHAHERRSRHTLDGSMHVMMPSSDDSETSKVGGWKYCRDVLYIGL